MSTRSDLLDNHHTAKRQPLQQVTARPAREEMRHSATCDYRSIWGGIEDSTAAMFHPQHGAVSAGRNAGQGSNTLHTTHYTLHTTHYTPHVTHYTLHTTHCTLHSTHYTLHSTHYTLHTTHDTLHTKHNTLHSTQCTLELGNAAGAIEAAATPTLSTRSTSPHHPGGNPEANS